ncbi:MAG: family 16 glycosylhydrolase [Microbacter sp.]
MKALKHFVFLISLLAFVQCSTGTTPNVLPKPVISGPAQVNQGDVSTYSIPTTQNTLSWKVNDSIVGSTNPVMITWKNAGTFKVTVTVSDGKSTVVSDPYNVTVAPSLPTKPSISTGGNPPVAGIPFFIQASSVNATQYTWYVNGKQVGTTANLTFSYTFSNVGIDTVQVVASNGNGSATSDKVPVRVDYNPSNIPSNLTWSDEFNGTTLDMTKWNFDLGQSGWGNNELENYTNSNDSISNGILYIIAKLVGPGQTVGSYTSCRINTAGKESMTYGRIEVSAKLPVGKGTWPAFWMLGSDFGSIGWPGCGEVDIMEEVGYDPGNIHGSIHTPSSYGNTVNTGTKMVSSCSSQYHIYGVIWTPVAIRFYIDDPSNIYYTYNPATKNASTWPFDNPCFIILNLAIGGNWGGVQGVDDSIFPQYYSIDYVRVYSF